MNENISAAFPLDFCIHACVATPMKNLTEKDFSGNEYTEKERTVVVFHATWCPFCRRFVSSYDRLVEGIGFRAALADVSDPDSRLWDDFSIDVIPTAIIFDGGKAVSRLDGISGVGIREKDFIEFVSASD